MMVDGPDWVRGRYPQVVDWLCRQHDHGALLASACTGVLLLAETGLLKGREATIHWAFAPTFHRNFPDVCLHTEEALIAVGDEDGDEDIVMTGGVMSWHDLTLYLIARYVGPVAAQAMARMLMLEWRRSGPLHRVHTRGRSRRRLGCGAAEMAGAALHDRQSGRGNDDGLGPEPPNAGAPIPQGDGAPAHLLYTTVAHP
jgi:transcriptional regulator GlxA family with amidase domain